MIIEGKNSVYEALVAGVTFNKLIIQQSKHDEMGNKIIGLAKSANIKYIFADKSTLDKLSKTGRHQGFLGEITEFAYCEVDDIINNAKAKNEQPIIVILDCLEDPHNLGSIIRVCDCAGVHGIIIPKQRAVSVNDTVIKVSAGASNHVMISRVTNINTTIDYLKKQNFWVYGAEAQGENIYKTSLDGSIAIVIGSEGKGISKLTLEKCDGIISIPMYGKVNSLNASTAASVVIYEAVRQRRFK